MRVYGPRHAGRRGRWWLVAFWIQAWHHLEHLILLSQAVVGANLWGHAAPVSLVQLLVPRVELHLFYNTAVFLPMLAGVYYHLRPSPTEHQLLECSCHPPRVATPTVAGLPAG